MALQRWHTDGWGHIADGLADDDGPPSRFYKWVVGIGGACVFAVLAALCWVSRKALLPGHLSTMPLEGGSAIAMGVVLLAIGVFLFAHYFCSNSQRLGGLTDIGKMISLLGFIGGLGFILFCHFVPR